MRNYTVDEAAKILGVHPTTLRNAVRRGLPSLEARSERNTRMFLLPESSLEDFRKQTKSVRRLEITVSLPLFDKVKSLVDAGRLDLVSLVQEAVDVLSQEEGGQ